MKKTITLILAVALVFALSACSIPSGNLTSGGAENSQTQSDNTSQTKQEAPVSSSQDIGNESSVPQDTQSQSSGVSKQPQTQEPVDSTPVSSAQSSANSQQTSSENTGTDLISRQDAIDIALKSAKLTKNDVYDIDAELDVERNGKYWEVDFETQKTEYSYEIDAVTGKIVKQEIERND